MGLNEIAVGNAMSAGAVEGGAVGVKGGPWRRGKLKKQNKEEEERSRLSKENVDLSMVDDVMRLIMQRGILR